MVVYNTPKNSFGYWVTRSTLRSTVRGQPKVVFGNGKIRPKFEFPSKIYLAHLLHIRTQHLTSLTLPFFQYHTTLWWAPNKKIQEKGSFIFVKGNRRGSPSKDVKINYNLVTPFEQLRQMSYDFKLKRGRDHYMVENTVSKHYFLWLNILNLCQYLKSSTIYFLVTRESTLVSFLSKQVQLACELFQSGSRSRLCRAELFRARVQQKKDMQIQLQHSSITSMIR